MSQSTCYTLKDLRSIAKNLGIRGYSSANKAKLVEMLDNHANTKDVVDRVQSRVDAQEHAPAPTPASTPAPEETKTEKVFVQEEPKKADSEAPPKKKRYSPWNAFLSEYRQEHGCSLKEAMNKKDEYAAWKAKQSKDAHE